MNEIFDGMTNGGAFWVTESIFDDPQARKGTKHTQLRAPTLIYARERRDVVSILFRYFTQQGLSNADYTEIMPFDAYLESSQRYEKEFILAAQTLNDAHPVFMDRRYCFDLLPSQDRDLLNRAIAIKAIKAPLFELDAEPNIGHCLQKMIVRQDASKQYSLHCYAIIDAAIYQQDERFLVPDLIASGLTWRCLFKGESESVMENIAPYLVDITPYADKQTLFHQRLITLFTQQPLGIIIQSKESFGIVYHHLRKFTYVKNPETQRWCYLRFYDPRALPTIISLMDYSGLASFMRHALAIIYLQPNQSTVINIISVTHKVRAIKGSCFRLTQRMCNYFSQSAYQAFTQKVDRFIEEHIGDKSQISEGFRSYFIVQHINQALRWGFSLEKPVLLYVAARSMSYLPEIKWGELVKAHTCRFPLSQELRAKHLFGLVWHLSEIKAV